MPKIIKDAHQFKDLFFMLKEKSAKMFEKIEDKAQKDDLKELFADMFGEFVGEIIETIGKTSFIKMLAKHTVI